MELCPRKDAPLSGLPTVGTSDIGRDFWPESRLPTQVETSGRPNKKAYSDLAFWILIWTVPNSWEPWKIRLGDVFYWDKTTPSKYHGRLSFHLSNRKKHNISTTICPNSPLSTPPVVRWRLSTRFIGILGGLVGPKRSSTCSSLTDPSGSGSGAFSAEIELHIGSIGL
jgi:hypothetical protein